MIRLFCSLLLSLACTLNAVDNEPPKEFSMTLQPAPRQLPRAVRLQIELSENDTSEYGLLQSALYNEIVTRLQLAQIQVKEDPFLPQLILRVKSIQADRAVASFIQLAFFEEAVLTRNQGTVQALTWSQATMVSCAKEDVVKEITGVVIQMINTFIMDYQKAMVPL